MCLYLVIAFKVFFMCGMCDVCQFKSQDESADQVKAALLIKRTAGKVQKDREARKTGECSY